MVLWTQISILSVFTTETKRATSSYKDSPPYSTKKSNLLFNAIFLFIAIHTANLEIAELFLILLLQDKSNIYVVHLLHIPIDNLPPWAIFKFPYLTNNVLHLKVFCTYFRFKAYSTNRLKLILVLFLIILLYQLAYLLRNTEVQLPRLHNTIQILICQRNNETSSYHSWSTSHKLWI